MSDSIDIRQLNAQIEAETGFIRWGYERASKKWCCRKQHHR